MVHTSDLCNREGCQDPHPYHKENGLIQRSIRPANVDLLFDQKQATETIWNPNLLYEISQNDYDYLMGAR